MYLQVNIYSKVEQDEVIPDDEEFSTGQVQCQKRRKYDLVQLRFDGMEKEIDFYVHHQGEENQLRDLMEDLRDDSKREIHKAVQTVLYP